MTTYLLDNTVFSLLVKEHPTVRARLGALEPTHRIVICTVVRGEVLYGLERMAQGKKRQDLETKIMELFANLPCEPIPEDAGNHYSRIKRETERRGTRLDENDLWIGATAVWLGAILVTTDSDFQRVRGLKIENWL